MSTENAQSAAPVDRLVRLPFAVNDIVVVEVDGDGAIGCKGIVSIVWPSGRCTVTFPDGSFRSLSSDTLRRA
jgi:hypothetical protein